MILKKEWLGFILCWLLLLVLTTISHFHFRNQFHSRILDSQNEILASELNRIAEQIEFDLLERDITLLELGLTDLSSNQNEFLVKVIIQALSIPKVQEIFAYDTFGKPIVLDTGTGKQLDPKFFQLENKPNSYSWLHKKGELLSIFLKIDSFEESFIFEVSLEEDFLLREWSVIDEGFIEQGLYVLLFGSVLLFSIFSFMSLRIQSRERTLKRRNLLLQKTNQKLAQLYKTTSLGALTGHLMHSLKNPLNNLQIIAKEANENQSVDSIALQDTHNRLRDLVSQSLLSLQEIEDSQKLYEMSLREIFQIVTKRTIEIARKGKLVFEENDHLEQKFDNLNCHLLTPILVSLIENAFESKADSEVTVKVCKKNTDLCILVADSSGGIPKSERDFLFDPSKSGKKGGTGLGLALAHQLAQSMSARLELEKSTDYGSEFSLTLNNDQNELE